MESAKSFPAFSNQVHRLIESEKLNSPSRIQRSKSKAGPPPTFWPAARFSLPIPINFHWNSQKTFSLISALQWGTLPKVNHFPGLGKTRIFALLLQYYLKEEIKVEQIVRRMETLHSILRGRRAIQWRVAHFSRSAETAGQTPRR